MLLNAKYANLMPSFNLLFYFKDDYQIEKRKRGKKGIRVFVVNIEPFSQFILDNTKCIKLIDRQNAPFLFLSFLVDHNVFFFRFQQGYIDHTVLVILFLS
jgi:hypothetical protein